MNDVASATAMAPRRLLQGASNFRDLGGYAGRDGARVRGLQVFRSDHLAGLSAADVAQLQDWGVTHSLDFRGEQERQATPYAWPGLVHRPLGIEPTVVRRLREWHARGEVPTAADTVAVMCQTYRDFALHHGPVFGRFMRHLIEEPGAVVFHCTSGKDRTGFAAALLLSALGVDEATIEHDYLLTNLWYQPPASLAGQLPEDVRQVLWFVRPEFLHAALDTVRREHGSLARYLRGPVGLSEADLAALERRLLV